MSENKENKENKESQDDNKKTIKEAVEEQEIILKEPVLLLNDHTDSPQSYKFLKGTLAVFTTKSPDKEGANQDSLGIIPIDDNKGVIAIADGLGGHKKGDDASKIAIQTLKQSLSPAQLKKYSMRECIFQGIEKANEKVHGLGVNAGTTLAIIEIDKDQVRFYSIGDSSVQLISKTGKLKYKNVEHSPVGYGVEGGFLEEQEALEHEDSNLILNALGEAYLKIECCASIKLATGDTLLAASDGLTGNILSEELLNHIKSGPLDKKMTKVLEQAKDQMLTPHDQFGSPDDLSFILFRMEN